MKRYFSMFTGVGGFELGIQEAYDNYIKTTQSKGDKSLSEYSSNINGKPRTLWGEQSPACVGFSEIDKYASQLLQIKWSNTKNYGDATKIDETKLPDFDLLVGGFPCQSFSIAGKRKGFDDTRGTLFFDIARILAHKRPKYLVLENVKGLLSHDGGRTFQTIIRVLTDLGYFVEWQVLNSKNFGVPQNRERVFIIGYFGEQPRQKVFPVGERNSGVDEGNEKTTQTVIAPTIDARVGDSTHRSPYIKQLNNPTHSNDRVYGYDGISPTLNSMRGIRRLTPLEYERLQGFPDNWTKDFSDTQRYKMMGNAVTVNVVKYIIGRLCLSVL